ncbi:unnamed protein product [Scytosiphon promiscuus]
MLAAVFSSVLAFVAFTAVPLPQAEAAACAASVVQAHVASPADAQDLASALDCTGGGGVFNVTWTGSVVVTQPFNISAGAALTVTGVGGGADETAVIDAEGADGIFVVSGVSALNLENLVLQGGNSSENGGAIRVEAGGSVINLSNCDFLDNHAAGYGGAIFADFGELVITGDTRFMGNSAGYRGGALYGNNSVITIGENSAFAANTAAGDGGALYTDNSSVAIYDEVAFTNNTAGDRAGAIRASFSNVTIEDVVVFTNNTAVNNGGAINSWFTAFTFRGAPVFDSNAAAGDGGAISAYQTNLTILDTLAFVNNSAGGYGGAFDASVSTILIEDEVTFGGNTALNGGAVFLYECVAYLDGGSFTENSAGQSGGAMTISKPADVWIGGVSFVSNVAEIGGAVALTAAGEQPTRFDDCAFELNGATDGGAVYMSTNEGQEVVYNCSFFGNYAGKTIDGGATMPPRRISISGGAIFHTGYLGIYYTVFAANEAGQDGTAVFSIGVVEKAVNVTFDGNILSCPLGEYGYEEEAEDGACRFELACARCAVGCDDIPPGVVVTESKVPVCVELMEGVEASSTGTTVATLDLKEGYYRVSAESQAVLECHLEDACVGGVDVEGYCADGYRGPYCAVCADGYAPGTAYICSECSGSSMESAVGVAATALAVILLVVAIVVSDLVQIVDGNGNNQQSEEGGARGALTRGFARCYAFSARAFPLTSVKIIVVVWQIITQFGTIAGFVYPDAYQKFLDALLPVNLDIGSILSYSCLVTTGFYDRLVIATIAPVAVLAALGATFFVARRRNAGSLLALRTVRHKHLSAALFVMFFVYSSVSFTVFQTFVCETLDDGVSYLRADYSLTCDTPAYRWFRVYAAIMVCIYPIGIPATFAVLLGRNRRDLRDANRDKMAHLEPLVDLWGAYKPSRYYYEVVECGRRIMLTGVAVFVLPDSAAQIAVVLLLAVVFLFISESLSPFAKGIDMGLYRWANGIILASMYVALLLKVDVSKEGNGTLSAFVSVLIAANIFMVVCVIVQSILLVMEYRSSVRESRDPLSRSKPPGWPQDAGEDDEGGATGTWEGGCFHTILSSNANATADDADPPQIEKPSVMI